jgi:hypothetical protein
VQYVIDEMSLESIIRPHPIGFKQKLRVQKTLLDFFKKRMSQSDKVREEIDKENAQHSGGNMLRLRRIY